jgi:molecular chaperone HscB
MDAFDVFGLAPAFDLDQNELERRYRELQKQLHPDKFVHATRSERRESLSRAVSVNEAYQALRDELKRADLVLTRHAGAPVGKATVDPELLMEVMELREALASARKRGDLAAARALSARWPSARSWTRMRCDVRSRISRRAGPRAPYSAPRMR